MRKSFTARLLSLALLALPAAGAAQVTTVGGKPTSTSATVPLKVTTDGSLALFGGAVFVKSGAPSFSVNAGVISTAATGLTAGTCYRLACASGTVYWRTGSGTPTALLTDNPSFGPSVEGPICLPTTDTAFAFITASGTVACVGTLMSRTP